MKEGEKLGTNEARVEKHGQLGTPAKTCTSRAGFYNTNTEKRHPPEQLFDNCKLQYLLSALTVTPFSHK